jgi:hypothetical protein
MAVIISLRSCDRLPFISSSAISLRRPRFVLYKTGAWFVGFVEIYTFCSDSLTVDAII